MRSQYLIKSRYGEYSVLNQLDDKEYIFIPTPGSFRVIGSDMSDITAIDPSGGPMINKGDKLFDFEVEKIYRENNLIKIKIK